MKKRMIALLTAVVMVCCLAACSGSPAAPDSGQPDSQGQEPAAGQAKDTIVFAQSSDIISLDFHVGKTPANYDVTCNMFDTLVTWDADNNVIPHLAESWEFLGEDSLQMHLRQGILFHDGVEMTAEDVQFTLTRAMNSTIVRNNFSWLESVEVVDPYTVIIHTKGPYTPVLNALCNPLAGIMPKHLLEADDEAMAKNPVGTGPYKFVERKEGESVRMEANENYWNGTVATKYLEMRVIPEASQRATLLETGEIDVAYDVLASDVQRLRDNGGTDVLSADSFKVFYLTVNCNSGTAALRDSGRQPGGPRRLWLR